MAERIVPDAMKHFYDRFHFAPAVVDGDRIFCSGQMGTGERDRLDPDPETQFEQAFANVRTVLDAAGVTLADIIEMTTYHVDMTQHLRAFIAVKDRHIVEPYPAWTAIGVSELAFPGALVEIRIVAHKR